MTLLLVFLDVKSYSSFGRVLAIVSYLLYEKQKFDLHRTMLVHEVSMR